MLKTTEKMNKIHENTMLADNWNLPKRIKYTF